MLATIIVMLANPQDLKAQSKKWYERIGIRESFSEDESKQNPAILTFTLPKSQSNSYLIDAGLGYRLRSSADGLRSGNLVAEYHRTNVTDGEVNNFQAGYKSILIFKKPIAGPLIQGAIPEYSTPRLNSTLKYRGDAIEGTRGAAAVFMLGFFQTGNSHKIWWNETRFSASQRFHYIFSPEIGIEMQQNFQADSTKMKGFFGRPLARLGIGFGQSKPDPAHPGNRQKANEIWLFNVDAALRYDAFGKTGYTSSKYHPFIKTTLDFFLLYKPVSLIIGASFVYGDNPIDGFREVKFKRQQFWLFGLKIQK